MKEETGWWFRLRALFRRTAMERELDEEMQFHIDRETSKQIAAGVEPKTAEREALERFGRVGRHKDAARTAWGVRFFDELTSDTRFAFRHLTRQKSFALVAVLTLALGVGGTVALGSAVYGLLLRALPYEDSERVRVFWADYGWSAAEFDFVRENLPSYETLAAYSDDGQTLRNGDRTSMVHVGLVSGDTFSVLGATPLRGRLLRRDEERLAAPPVAILSFDFWRREYASREDIVGSQIELDAETVTVIGVMPRGFYFPSPEVDLWRPLVVDAADSDYAHNHWLVILGRLAEGISEEQAAHDLDRFVGPLGEKFHYPEAWDKTLGYFTVPIRTYLLGAVRPALLLLFAAVALLLLMASTNVAALFLARMSDRLGELEIRKAMGAGRFRLSRQLLTESLVLGIVSSVFGLSLALVAYRAIVERLPLPGGFDQTLAFDWRMVVATLVLTPFVALLVALAPIRGLWRRRVSSGPLNTRGLLGSARGRLQHSLIVGEVAIAALLVICATLLGRSVVELYRLDPGFDPEGVAMVDLFLADAELEPRERRAFFMRLIEAVTASAEVSAAAVVNRVPLRDQGVQGPIEAEGRADLVGAQRPNSKWRYVSPDYFKTLGIELQDGRWLDARDREDTTQVALMGIDFAEKLWPGESAVGKRVKLGFQYQDWIEIVGVVDGVSHDSVREGPSSVIYRPLAQVQPWSSATLLVRATKKPQAALSLVRDHAREIDSRVALARPMTMEEVLESHLAEPLRLRFFLGLFSLMALVIGAVGVYGVVSYRVSRRRPEYGLRLALGAGRRDLVLSVLGNGFGLVSAGIVAGIVLALGASFLLARFLYGVDPRDPLSYLVAAVTLVVVAMAATFAPAYRASRVDPATTLQGG